MAGKEDGTGAQQLLQILNKLYKGVFFTSLFVSVCVWERERERTKEKEKEEDWQKERRNNKHRRQRGESIFISKGRLYKRKP